MLYICSRLGVVRKALILLKHWEAFGERKTTEDDIYKLPSHSDWTEWLAQWDDPKCFTECMNSWTVKAVSHQPGAACLHTLPQQSLYLHGHLYRFNLETYQIFALQYKSIFNFYVFVFHLDYIQRKYMVLSFLSHSTVINPVYIDYSRRDLFLFWPTTLFTRLCLF